MSLLFDVPLAKKPVRMQFPAYQAASTEEFAADQDVAEEHAGSMEMIVEAARLAGMDDGRAAAELDLAHKLTQERQGLQAACASFARARDAYFAGMERSVVQLALSIAAKIVGREVALDPLLLCGVVHVALHEVATQDGVVLRVPHDDVKKWQERSPGLAVEGDAAMVSGDCRLESPVGVAELGVAAQLAEIERGFFDLLSRRQA